MTQAAILTELAMIWSDVLGIPRDRIGADANFFQYGDSLAALEVCGRVEERFRYEVPVLVLAENPTLNALARWLRERTENESAAAF